MLSLNHKLSAILKKPIFQALAFFIILFPIGSFAQTTISGKVINQADDKPVENASVFLANATIGGKTTETGTFSLRGVEPGKYELVVSVVGFKPYRQTLLAANGALVLPDIILIPKVTTLKEVVVRVDHNRDRNLEWFTDEFLGSSPSARECKIINPEVLDLSYDDENGILTASSDEFLIIENDALGYRINYLLADFTLNNKNRLAKEVHYDGSVLFQEMNGKAEQQEKWENNRQQVYQNSSLHFLRSLINNKIEEEGFEVHQIATYPNPKRPDENVIQAEISYYQNAKPDLPHRHDSLAYWTRKAKQPRIFQKLINAPLAKNEIIEPTGRAGVYKFGCDNDALYVVYNKGHHFHAYNNFDRLDARNTDVTVLNFNKPFTLIDNNGAIFDPAGITFNGVWAMSRIGDLLPINYASPHDTVAPADSTVMKNTTGLLNTFLTKNVKEKAYLHFDRPYYAAGDTMYFKAYVTLGDKHHLSNLSGVLHVDFFNDKYKPLESIRLQLMNGVAWGDFALADSLAKGNYRVRAYTQFMRNKGEDGFFTKTIPVAAVKNIKISESIITQNNPGYRKKADIQFFPEGGSFVAGINNKVAFKAIGKNGLGINVKGVLVDDNNKEVASFASAHLGMGAFYINPAEGRTYHVRLSYSDGGHDEIALSKPEPKGVALSVNNDLPSVTSVSIQANKIFYRENRNKDYTLVVYAGGIIRSAICKLDKPAVSIDIDKGDLRSGTARVTLFSPSGEPVSERLFFIKGNDRLSLHVSTDKKGYTKREKVKIGLNALSKEGNPAAGHFSVTVIDESQVLVDDINENTILTNLLLTSELKGYVEQPNYYFASDSKEVADNLDLLMLTQGFRKFEWKKVLANKPTEAIAWQPEISLDLVGVLKTVSGNPVPRGEVTMIAAGNNIIKDMVTDINGNFKFSDLDITGNPTVLVRASKENKGSNVKIEIQKEDVPALTQSTDPSSQESDIPLQTATAMQQKFIYTATARRQLKEVKIEGYTHSKPDLPYSANLNGPGKANFIIMGNQMENCSDLSCLYSKIPGMISKDGKLYLVRTGARLGQGRPDLIPPPPSVKIFIDGVPYDQSQVPLNFINIKDIYSIEALTSASYLALYGTNAAGGALIITTNRGSENVNKPVASPLGLVTFPFKGFYKSRDFYLPKYAYRDNNVNRKDLRSTVYWNPELLTDKEGNASFEYFNADGHGAYRVVVEGIDDHGNLGRQIYRYSVE